MVQSHKMYQLSCAPFLCLVFFLICSSNAGNISYFKNNCTFVFKHFFVANSTNETAVLKAGEKKISEYIVAILEHFKQKDPVGIPGAPIPDPMDIPPFKHSFSVGTLNCKNVKMHGLSKFRLDRVKTDVANMEVNAALTIDKLDVYGNYTLSSFFSSSKGPFTVNLKGVYAQTNATLEVMKEGHLEAQEMSMDITFKNMAMNFENLGFFASMFQSVINSVGNVMFDTIKPLILREMNTNMRNDINKQVKQVPLKFPNSISPFDQVVAEARKKVRSMGYDPYRVEDYNNSVGIFEVQMSNTWLYGISSFHRVGNITFLLVNNTVQADVKVGTQRLEGTSQWEISLAGMVSRSGTVSFSVEYLQVSF